MRDYLAAELVQDCGDGLLTRREALRRLGLLGVSLATATTLLAACGDDDDAPGAASSTTTTAVGSSSGTDPAAGADADADAEMICFAGPSGEVAGVFAAPSSAKGAVLVIHENRGLTAHFHDLVGRLAADDYAALAVDLLTPEGGTASLEEADATAGLSAAPESRLLGDLRAGIDELGRRASGAKVGAMGFCFGGGMVWRLLAAGEGRLAAAVPFYGTTPADPDFSGSDAAVLAIYGGLDGRVTSDRPKAEAALEAAGLTYEVQVYEGANHAFFNDTGARYDRVAAVDAYRRVLDWFGRHLV
ncbi:MAG: dienelactone hydrolase family protein [Acidimicrobiia bacterium]